MCVKLAHINCNVVIVLLYNCFIIYLVRYFKDISILLICIIAYLYAVCIIVILKVEYIIMSNAWLPFVYISKVLPAIVL